MSTEQTWTIRLELTIAVDELMANSDLPPNAGVEDQRDEISSIGHQWAFGLEEQTIPKCRSKVLASRHSADETPPDAAARIRRVLDRLDDGVIISSEALYEIRRITQGSTPLPAADAYQQSITDYYAAKRQEVQS